MLRKRRFAKTRDSLCGMEKGSAAHLKYGCFIASSAPIRRSGSYVKSLDIRSSPASVKNLNLLRSVGLLDSDRQFFRPANKYNLSGIPVRRNGK